MGLFSAIKKITKKVLKPVAKVVLPTAAGFFGGAELGAAVERVVGGGVSTGFPGASRPFTTLPALPGGFAPPPITRPLPRPPGGGLPIIPRPTGVGCPAGFHPAKDRSGRCVRNRRMNPLNPRAARRAIRRIKGAMKVLKSIERQLPKQRTRRAPSGHRARLTHQ